MSKWVYRFGGGSAEGDATLRALLGGKGANLAEMARIGLPVPPGFTITTEVCARFYRNNREYPKGLRGDVEQALHGLEETLGRRFGDPECPLLVSVRSGARVSMPGMMDTVLNLGLNDETVEGLARRTGNPRFAWDSYRRFIQMYGDVVMGVDHHLFEEAIEERKTALGVDLDTDLGADDWRELVARFKQVVRAEAGRDFPQAPDDQLWGAIGAVFGSWNSERAKVYRRLHDIPDDWGTAVNVQAMVFGNLGERSATGVAFTRNPATGAREIYGEFLINAQGEDVVAGIRTPQHLTKAARLAAGDIQPSMEEAMPDVFSELVRLMETLERHYRDMQDIEFTVEEGRLWLLQTRAGKRTAKAAIRIAVDMSEEGLIDRREAVTRVDPESLDQLLHPTLDPQAPREVVARGLPASPGAASGEIVFTADEAERRAKAGHDVILVRVETSPEDIHGMHAARGILTARGGMTSHAAVVARGMGRACVSGAAGLFIDMERRVMEAGGRTFHEGDEITIDGTTGEVIAGRVPTVAPELSGEFATLMRWADGLRRMKVRTNADTPHDAAVARRFGAEGIGLARTEHMFFDAARIAIVREMILADNVEERRHALAKLLEMQRGNFLGIFREMEGLPVTIRLLDPPLHEFLPHEDAEFAQVARASGLDVGHLKRRAAELREANPMLGHRGCRLAVTFPEIYEMQVRAIIEAAITLEQEEGCECVLPEIMVPLVSDPRELRFVKDRIEATAKAVFADKGRRIDYRIGTMIELPRAALTADEIAEEAEFFSFGTNDLTQTTYGLSRDDAGRFLPIYLERGIYPADPFAHLDTVGVGALMRIARDKGRGTRGDLKLGICGEHGGDPASIDFCEELGLDYVSCSPYRVPIARLAAAQAAIRRQSGGQALREAASG
ncbi:MAG: pyruvate, phosphate dikinase [Alphaproteobacteria bacterium]|nr:MAG: pyruvate, phosphate dikinase [Alphaproteobacteria bacterium]